MASYAPVDAEEAGEVLEGAPVFVGRSATYSANLRRVAVAGSLLGVLGAVALVATSFRVAPSVPAAALPTEGLDQDAVVQLALSANTLKTLLGAGAVKTVDALGKSNDLRIAACTLNVLQASNYLARAGVQIDQATKTCTAPALVGYSRSYDKKACLANAAGVFASVGFVATYLSLAASQCAKVADVDAVCAATIEGIVAALGGLAVQASFVAANCGGNAPSQTEANTHTDAIWQMDRRLSVAPGINKRFQKDRNAEMATCVLDVTEAMTSLGQMGYNVESSRRGCKLWEATKGVPVVNGNTRAICAVSIGEVLYGVGKAATFIAAATSHCAVGINVPALCATGVSGLLTSLAGVVYLGSGMNLACTELQKLGPLKDPVATLLGQGIARRLGSANSTEGSLI